jgi:hypothetical protein
MLLTIGNPKTEKGRAHGYLTAILHLAPYTLAGEGNVCPYASEGCVAACLNTAGRGGIFAKGAATNAIQEARKRKTRALFADRPAFLATLAAEVRRFAQKARNSGLKPALRLNGTSDLAWERLAPDVLAVARAEGVTLYDYTKSEARAKAQAYPLTFSRSERTTDAQIRDLTSRGVNVAVVFDRSVTTAQRQRIARERWGADVIDGDASDLRFLDPRGVIVGLTAKGRARKDATGFVVRG